MLDYVELGGKKRPLLFGNAAFKMLKQRTGVGMMAFLDAMHEGDLDGISDITFCALRVGEIATKQEPSEDLKDETAVAIWLDEYPGGVTAFLQKIVDSLPKPQAGEGEPEPGEAQATGIGTSSKLEPAS